MATSLTVKEGSTSYHPLEMLDRDGVAVIPEALRYKVTGENGVELVPWSSLSINAELVEISATVNTIGLTGGKKRYLTMEATHSGGDKITDELEYGLVNLKGITPPPPEE